MKLSGIAVCALLAAAILPWLEPVYILFFGGACLLAFLPVFRNYRPTFLTLFLCLIWGEWLTTPRESDLRTILGSQAQSARLRFQVMGDLDEVEFIGSEKEIRIPARVTAHYRSGQWEKAKARIQIRMSPEEASELMTGTYWEGTGVLKPGNFSYVGLFRSDWSFQPDPGQTASLEQGPGLPLLESFFRVRNQLAEGINASCSDQPEISATLQALLLGRRTEMDRKTLQLFARTGLIHVFAISGLHLGLLTGMMMAAYRWMELPRRFIPWVILPILLLFSLYTGLRASSLRALIMIACLLSAASLYRRPHLKNAFALAILVILGIAPGQVFDVGFQYSFLLVGGLILFGKHFGDKIQDWFAPDPWSPSSPGRDFRMRHLWLKLQGAAVVTSICFVVSAPLTAYHFNLFSPVGLLGNLLAVPLVFGLLASGFPALVSLGFPSSVSSICFLPAKACAGYLMDWVELLEKIPGGIQWVRSPSLGILFAGYLLVFTAVFWPRIQKIALALLFALLLYAGTDAYLTYLQPKVYVLDAGRGQATYLRLPGKNGILVDTGSAWSGRGIVSHLKRRGVDHINTLILTHPDRQHVEGFSYLNEVYPPAQILVSERDQGHPLYSELLPEAKIFAEEDRHIGGWTIEKLSPAGEPVSGRADDRSLVLRFTHEFNSFLFMGGAGKAVQARIAGTDQNMATQVLLAGHPSKGALVDDEFLEATAPQVVVFSGEAYGGISEQRKNAESDIHKRGISVLRVPEGGFLDLNPFKQSFHVMDSTP